MEDNPKAWRDSYYKYLKSQKGKEMLKRSYNKKMSNPSAKMAVNLRCRIADAFRAAKKQGFDAIKKTSTLNLLGAQSWEQIQYHIESQFLEGMFWENHGEWHIDHHKPVDWFIKNKDLTKEDQEIFNNFNDWITDYNSWVSKTHNDNRGGANGTSPEVIEAPKDPSPKPTIRSSKKVEEKSKPSLETVVDEFFDD